MTLLTPDQLDDVRRRNPVQEVAGPATLRRSGVRLVGPCPICGGSRRSSRFEVDLAAQNWVCAVCCDGGDVIKLVMRRDGVDFRTAVERLGGAGDAAPDAQAEARRAAMRERREREADTFRRREIARAYAIWAAGKPAAGSPVEAYLVARGCLLPPGPHLRFAPQLTLWGPGDRPRPLHKGPAMLAGITGPEGKFSAVHMTWLDPSRPGRKLEVADPDTGETAPAKKVRGSKRGGRIELARCAAPRLLIMGEGIETALSVWTIALRAGERLDDVAVWASVDLGNLGGPARATVEHPSARHRNGHRVRVPGPEPDLEGPAIPIPDSVRELTLLGDGDSEPFLTRNAVARAAARYAQPGRIVRAAFAPAGQDFNDMLMEAAA